MRVLVCGAGIAGSTLAFWLARHGFQVSVVERPHGLRSSGAPVDVHGLATDVARRVGVLDRLKERRTRAGPCLMTSRHPRADIASILCEAAQDDSEHLLDDSITALSAEPRGVNVAFAWNKPRLFNLANGADGRSRVREQVFGPEDRFVRPLGLYIATIYASPSRLHRASR